MLYRLVSWNPLLRSRQRGEKENAPRPSCIPSFFLALGYRATSISGSSVNPPFARLDVYVSYDFSTIARLHRFDGSFELRTRSFYLRPSFIRVICGMSRPRVIYADITCNKWIQSARFY